jgi:RHS repeat-associated protein
VVDTNVSGTSFVANLSAGKQYRWNVNACNGAGCSSYSTALYFQTPGAVTVPPVPGSPSPGSSTSPGPTTASTSVVLSWGASGGATFYGLGVRDLATNTLVVDANVNGTSFTANLSAGKQYRWNVNACNSAGCSSYTTALYFQTPGAAPATPASPSPGSAGSPGPTTAGSSVTLSWSASSGATYYGLGVRDIAANVLVVDTNVTGGSSYVANLSAGKQYRWNVNACNAAGCSSYTTPLYFQTPGSTTIPATPTNLGPGSTAGPGPATAGTGVTLTWGASSGATYYGLGVRDMATNTLVIDTNVGAPSFTASLSAGRQYRWNVNACNGAGCSSFAAPLYFQTPTSATIGAPALSAPSNGSAGASTTPTFNWTAVSGANRYWLTVASSPSTLPTDPFATTCPACVISGNTDATSYTAPYGFPYGYHTATLSAGTTYYWKVQAWNSGGAQGGYSAVYSFTTAGPATNPSIGVLPSSGTLGTSFRFTGSGFTHNNLVTLNVTRPDGSGGGGGKYSTDSNGNVTFNITSQAADPTGQWGFRLTDDSSGKQTSTNAQYTSAQQSGTDAMYFSASSVDVTIPDNDQRSAGSAFTKTWRFKNSGTTTWSGYTAVFVANPANGNPSINLNAGGATSAPVPLTSPGQTVDFSIPMRAPGSPGTYYSYWQLRNANGVAFGAQFYVKIRVAPPQRAALGFGTETGRGGTNDSPPSNAGRNADPVNTATGNYNYAAADLRVPGRGLDVEFARSYNSQDVSTGPLGNGWSHSFNIFLTNITASGLSVHYSDGKVLEYVQQPGTATFTSGYPGYYDTLVSNGDGSWTLGKTDQRAYVFDSSGKLTAIRDRNSNQITLTYSGSNLSQVTDTVGRAFGFTYSGSRLTSVTDPAGRTLQFGYDSASNLTSFRDARGNLNTYVYDASNRLTRIVDGRQNNLVVNTYDGGNRVATQANGRGNLWQFVYNADGSTSVSDPLNNPTRYLHDMNFNMERTVDRNANNQNVLYDERNNRAHVSDANSNYSSYVYDGSGNVTTRTDANLKSRHAVYDSKNNPTRVVDEAGNQTQMSYDARGNLTALTNALGNSSSTSHDEFGQPLVSTDANGGVTLFGYDAQGNLTSVKDAQNNVTSYGYDAVGRRVSATDARGNTTRYGYDENDNLLSVTDPLGNATTYTYDANNNRTGARDPRGNTTTYAYDENNLLVKETDAKGNYVQHAYDSLDRRVSTRDKRGNVTSFTYDNEGRPLTVTDPLGNKTAYAYDANGNRSQVTDAGGQTTQFTYDALNRVTKIQDALGNSVQREYDAAGRLSKETDPRGNATAFSYDEVGNLTQVSDAAAGTARFAYDRNRNRVSGTDPNNHTSGLAYDKLNRLLSSKDPLNNTYAYTYDEAGNRATQTDARGQTTRYAYDEGGRLASVTYPNNSAVRLTYDAGGNITQMVDALGTTAYAYDELSRLTSYTDPFGKTIGYQYDAAGNITALTYPDGRQVTYQYDAGNRLTSLTDWAGKTTSYAYGSTNLLTKVTYPNGITTTLTYDQAGRLTAKSDAGVSSYSFTLDKGGNRTAASITQPLTARPPGASQGYAYDDANRILSAGAATFTFDANGNMTGKTEGGSTTTYVYDFEDRLTGVGGGTQYLYNGNGVRLRKAEGSAVTGYVVDINRDLSQVLCETDGSGQITSYYVYGVGLAYKVTPGGSHFYYHFDSIGSTVAMTDDARTVVNSYAYDSFGKVVKSFETTPNPYKFVGQYGLMDDGNGLTYVRARYYSSTVGRFLTKDLLTGQDDATQSLNRYAYALNNPIIYVDTDGRFAHVLAGALIGGIAGVAGTAAHDIVSSAINGKLQFSSAEKYVGSAVGGAAEGACIAGTGGLGLVGGVCGAAGAAVGNITTQELEIHVTGKRSAFSGKELAIDVGVGAVSGLLTGVGSKLLFSGAKLKAPVGRPVSNPYTRIISGRNSDYYLQKILLENTQDVLTETIFHAGTSPREAHASSPGSTQPNPIGRPRKND